MIFISSAKLFQILVLFLMLRLWLFIDECLYIEEPILRFLPLQACFMLSLSLSLFFFFFSIYSSFCYTSYSSRRSTVVFILHLCIATLREGGEINSHIPWLFHLKCLWNFVSLCV